MSGLIDVVSFEEETRIISRADAIEIVAVSLGSDRALALALVANVLEQNYSAKSAIQDSKLSFGIWVEHLDHIAPIIQSIADQNCEGISVQDLHEKMWNFFLHYRRSISQYSQLCNRAFFINRFKELISRHDSLNGAR